MATRQKRVLTFSDLKFEEHPTMKNVDKLKISGYKHEGVQAVQKFKNGLAISVIRMKMTITRNGKDTVIFLSYTTSDDEFEVMITASNPVIHDKFLKYVKEKGLNNWYRLGDPVGYLEKDDITEMMKELQSI